MMPLIEDVITQIKDWKGKSVTVYPIPGGLTNTNYKVFVGQPYFIRIPGESTELLAIDRKNEYFNTKAASQTGVGPKVHYYLTEINVMVLEFLNGTTMSNSTLAQPEMPEKITQAIKRLHGGPRFLTDFNMFRLTEYYLEICRQQDIRIPEGYPDQMRKVNQIEKAMAVHPLDLVPCNNDLLAENYIFDG
jgi:thiamine kinase-like enzyme